MASLSEKIAGWITAAGAVAAVFVAAVALNDTARQLAGKTAYDLAKDGKALQRRYEKGDAEVDEVMSYFFSAYRLHVTRVLDKDDWSVIETSLCNIVNGDKALWAAWEKIGKYYPSGFQDMVKKKRGQKCT
jgi:hypothetical protein